MKPTERQRFTVIGTTCTSCEVVIERDLRKHPDMGAVEVSYKDRTVVIEGGSRTFAPGELTKLVEGHGYRIVAEQEASSGPKASPSRLIGMLLLIATTYAVLDRLGALRFSPSATAPSGLLAVVAIGLVASVSSCTAVVGGLVVAVAGRMAKEQQGQGVLQRLRPHLLFNAGRIIGFAAFGAVVGAIGAAVQLTPVLNGALVLAVAVLMLAIGVNLAELFPAPVIAMPKWLAHRVHDLAGSDHPSAPMLLGALTFFLPCGFTQSMQLFALSLGSPLQAALTMAAFAIGTAPVLLGLGSLTAVASGATLRRVTKVAGILVVVLGLSSLVNGLTLLGVPLPSFSGTSTGSAAAVLTDGVQRIQMEVTEIGIYSPDVLTVQEGVPVEWEIFGADFMGCANTLVLPAFGVDESLHPGMQTVRFTPTRSGSFTFSCAMGMVRGTMIVAPKGN